MLIVKYECKEDLGVRGRSGCSEKGEVGGCSNWTGPLKIVCPMKLSLGKCVRCNREECALVKSVKIVIPRVVILES